MVAHFVLLQRKQTANAADSCADMPMLPDQRLHSSSLPTTEDGQTS